MRCGVLIGTEANVSYFALDGKLYRREPDYPMFTPLGDYHAFCGARREKGLTLPWES
jgi:hypothetical protein